MRSAYNETWLKNLETVKSARQWMKSKLITKENFDAIAEQHQSSFFHPNLIIRILLFLASLVVLGGITGLLALMFLRSEDVLSFLSIIYGLGSFVLLDRYFIAAKNQYKSGMTEALLYHSMLYIFLGFIEVFDTNVLPYAFLLFVLFTFSAIRYLDLISTAGALCAFAFIVFHLLYLAGGFFQQIVPMVLIAGIMK